MVFDCLSSLMSGTPYTFFANRWQIFEWWHPVGKSFVKISVGGDNGSFPNIIPKRTSIISETAKFKMHIIVDCVKVGRLIPLSPRWARRHMARLVQGGNTNHRQQASVTNGSTSVEDWRLPASKIAQVGATEKGQCREIGAIRCSVTRAVKSPFRPWLLKLEAAKHVTQGWMLTERAKAAPSMLLTESGGSQSCLQNGPRRKPKLLEAAKKADQAAESARDGSRIWSNDEPSKIVDAGLQCLTPMRGWESSLNQGF